MRQADLPVFDHRRCRSSGWCVAVCPTDCLDMWNDRPYLKYPQKCVSCAACVVACPADAVRIPNFTRQVSRNEAVPPTAPDGE